METNSDVEFDHFLAAKLGMLVADLRDRMSNTEWRHWYVYYQREAQRIELRTKGKG